MCGIAGVVAPHAERLVPLVEDMVSTLGHRGPDGSGVVAFPGCVLGASRLAVVDVAGGDQPMRRADGQAAVAFNGEIYGHRRLRAALTSYSFRTACDTEVLLALHAAHGPGLAERLPGMFAYALWDEARQRLECGRDRFGEKPLFWARGPEGEFAFASEIKALSATGWIDPSVDEVALRRFIRHGFTGPDRTIYRDVHVLGPAHRLEVHRGRVRATRYWTPPEVRRPSDRREAAEELVGLLDAAVTDQLEADVAVGAFLSGGLDSSSVVALAADHHDELHTFSFGFGGEDDETPHALRQATHSGTVHHCLGPVGTEVVDTVTSLARIYDEPFGDSSAVPTLLLSRATREHVTVALTGDGADELLGGYLAWSRHFLRDVGVRLPVALGGVGPSPLPWRRRQLTEAYVGFRSYLDPTQLEALGVADDQEATARRSGRATGTVADLLRFDLEGYLPGDVLVKTDRASMAHGLELRSPFLDTAVAEFCLSLPDEMKVDAEADKTVLREAMAPRLDPSVPVRAKQGFGGPMDRWLAEPAVVGLVDGLLGDPGARVYDLVAFDGVEPVLQGGGQAAWNLLVLALWAEEHARARR